MNYCKFCGIKLLKRKTASYCSNQCQMDNKINRKILNWLMTNQVDNVGSCKNHYMKRYISDCQNHSCAICGIKDWQGQGLVLILDHIDGDSTNNSFWNLRLICPNCDSQLPTFKSRNKGKGRHERRQRYAEGKSY